MKSEFGKKLEQCRVTSGPWCSPAGSRYGLFDIKRRDGRRLRVMVDDGELSGWEHVSVSMPTKTPSWEDMCWVKDLFFNFDEAVYQIHPRAQDYVNDHPHCLHLWRCIGEQPLLPPPELIGYGRKR